MKPSIGDQMKNIKLDFSEFGRLPIREDVLEFDRGKPESNKAILKQWGKLNLLRKHLQILDKYIQTNKGESVAEWLLERQDLGFAQHVLNEIGKYNNSTGGISAYFLNLQDYYDKNEQLYDDMETKVSMPDDLKNSVAALRPSREEKRKNRSKSRKIKFRDMKKNNKGFFVVEVEEPQAVEEKNSDAETPAEKETQLSETVKKANKKIGLYFAGAMIAITAIGVAISLSGNKK